MGVALVFYCFFGMFVCLFVLIKEKERSFFVPLSSKILDCVNFELLEFCFVFGSQLGMFSHCAHTFKESAAFSVELKK